MQIPGELNSAEPRKGLRFFTVQPSLTDARVMWRLSHAVVGTCKKAIYAGDILWLQDFVLGIRWYTAEALEADRRRKQKATL